MSSDLDAHFQRPEPNIPRITQWIEALESGEFAQTSGHLRVLQEHTPEGEADKYHYCCLGVATELFIRDTGASEDTWWSMTNFGETQRRSHEHSCLPPVVRDYYGFICDDPPLAPRQLSDRPVGGLEWSASSLNDSRGWSFESIAAAARIKFNIPKVDDAAPAAE